MGEALAGASAPSALVFIAQVLLAGVVASIVVGLPAFTNLVLPLIALVAIIVILVGLAAFSTSFTSSSEAAQYATLPLVMVLVFLSGSSLPLALLPEIVGTIGSFTPLYATGELITMGLAGTDLNGVSVGGFAGSWSAAVKPLLVLAGWMVASVALAVKYMRFEPRR